MCPMRIVPVAEVWFQTDGDLGDAFNLYRVRGRVHTDIVPKEAVIKALEVILSRLRNDSDKLLVTEVDQESILS